MFIKLSNDIEVNDFITAISVNVLDAKGNKLDLKPAYYTLVNLVTGKNTFPEKHYAYLGESVCMFAIRCLLSKIYEEQSVDKIKTMETTFQDLKTLANTQIKKAKLERFIKLGHSKDAFFYLLGILYDSFDSRVVERFIEPSIRDILSNRQLSVEEDTISTLTKLISSKKGSIDTSYVKIGTQWKAILTCKLIPNGIVFTYDAIGSSKQKAKAEACQAIVNYFRNNPDELKKYETGQDANNEVVQLIIPLTDALTNISLLKEETKKEKEEMTRYQAEMLFGHKNGAAAAAVIQPIGTRTDGLLDSPPYQPFPTATPFGPFTAYSSNKKAVDVFRDIFKNELNTLSELNNSNEIKGALLSMLHHKPNVTYSTTLNQTGEVHQPVFTVELEVISGKYTLKTTGSARKKKEAEIQAFQRFVRLLVKTP